MYITHIKCLSIHWTTQKVPLSNIQYTHSSFVYATLHTEWLYIQYDTHKKATIYCTETISTVKYTKIAPLCCAEQTQIYTRLYSTHK